MAPHVVRGGGRAIVDPERGGKIVSLRGVDGKEWLAQPGGPVRAPARGNAVFTETDPAGWDECAPSIDACDVGDRSVPDHGDLWTQAWTVESNDPDSLELSAMGHSLGYRIRRRITGTPVGFRFDYVVTAARSVPFLWAAHPQFVAPPGSAIELPATVRSVVDVLDPSQPARAWSPELSTLDTLPRGAFRKLYVEPSTRIDWATLRHPDGSALTLRWHNCPYLGLWFDNAAYCHEPVVAIEPSLGYRDSLAWALENGAAPVLAPGQDLSWSLELELSAATSPNRGRGLQRSSSGR